MPKSYYRQVAKVPTDLNKWVDATLYKPNSFDLVRVKDDKDNYGYAWWTGQEWDWGGRNRFSNIIKWQNHHIKDQ